MFRLEHTGVRLCDGMTRRRWLEVGALGTLGIAWPDLLQSAEPASSAATAPDSSASPRATAKACIQCFLWGGPSGQETWDPKPDAPDATRGDFRPIRTALPGVFYCEHLPAMAARADRYTILRSFTHEGVNHGTSAYHTLTGHVHRSPGTLRHPEPDDVPNLGVNAARYLTHPSYLPGYVHLPSIVNDGDGLPVPGQGAGFLGESHEPFTVLGDLTQPGFRVPALKLAHGVSRGRLSARIGLRDVIDAQSDHLDRAHEPRTVNAYYRRALDLLQSRETEAAFDLAREPARLRERYGQHHFAQALLLARRLVEAGVPLVTVYWNSPRNTDDQSWDTHQHQHRRLSQHLLPAFDRAMSALLDDLTERGLLDETLVTWFGEFGRTPKINRLGGRDHWGFCQSIGLAGGGIRQGYVHGSSNRDGGLPASAPVRPEDLSATLLHALGIAPQQTMHDLQGRPLPLSYGRVVEELLA